ncbi:hypothetical protein ACHAXT_007686 [Thalassiosira profunda]
MMMFTVAVLLFALAPSASGQRFEQRHHAPALRASNGGKPAEPRMLEEFANLSMSFSMATEEFAAIGKAAKADGGPAKPPSTPAPAKAAKADDEKAAKSEKSGKSDLSFSVSLSSKSGKSKSSKTQAPTPCVNPEVPSAKAGKSKSFSYGLDGSSKSGKSGLSFSMSLPSKSSKGEGAAKSAKGADTKASKSTIPCVTESPTKKPTEQPPAFDSCPAIFGDCCDDVPEDPEPCADPCSTVLCCALNFGPSTGECCSSQETCNACVDEEEEEEEGGGDPVAIAAVAADGEGVAAGWPTTGWL